MALAGDPVLVRFARFYATVRHAGQLYGDTLPYTHHLAAVDALVQEFWAVKGFSVMQDGACEAPMFHVVRAAAWLHDVMEDCGVKATVLTELFGPEVARLVSLVTDEDGPNRKVRKALTLPKVRTDPVAVYLKLCDRLASVREGGALLGMYAREQEEFAFQLRDPDGACAPLWEELDRRFAAASGTEGR